MKVTSLHRYPVKSLGGCSEQSLDLQPWGAVGDRRWALVEPDGVVVTARTDPSLLRLSAAVAPDEALEVTAPDGTSIAVPAPRSGPEVRVRFSRLDQATDAGEEAAAFFGAALGRPVRLVWQADPRKRAVNPDNGGLPGETLSLADAGPLLLTSQRSLGQLQDWVGPEPQLAMERMRPNIVLDGDEAFAEDRWDQVRLGDLDFRVQQRCDRCVMTTIDPVTLRRGPEPIRTLARQRKEDGKIWFGIWLVPQLPTSATGAIRVGDAASAQVGPGYSS